MSESQRFGELLSLHGYQDNYYYYYIYYNYNYYIHHNYYNHISSWLH